METIQNLGEKAKKASHILAGLSSGAKDDFLKLLADELQANQTAILAANSRDIQAAHDMGMNAALLDRLSLQGRLEGIINDILNVASLTDPVGQIFEKKTLPNGLQVSKVRTPIGVLGVIYEARPNVTIDIASLAVKTGNAVILRGGSETLATNQTLVNLIQNTLKKANLPETAVQIISSPDRKFVHELIKLDKYVDMIIPRGGASLQEFCKNNSSIPVITGGIGICHLYLDNDVDLDRALPVIYNSKVQRPAACNALDTLLVHKEIAETAVPAVIRFLGPSNVSFKLDEHAKSIASQTLQGTWMEASEHDWDTEWLGLTLGIKIIPSLDKAIEHILKHSLNHSDGILTNNKEHAKKFVNEVDSACVYVNASTRFTDGGQLGLGAEVAVTTQKLHARGPMGLQELTTYKWIIEGDYHVRK